ncbi:MAG TPA: zinc dependent phospholipase C family protein [Candidatus Sulfotelmatobacter sp.]|nr:zinc dependent phospholipase C family protein [Candidatus Sulfotelmatobacter sp.]
MCQMNWVKRLLIISIIMLVITSMFLIAEVKGWSNGGFSANPATPDYGTHDWIAERALDWLPVEEKQWLIDNKAAYLYGTELPDNNQAIDGIGDTTKHHVYYYPNGSVQDDVGAVRAKDEYTKALVALEMGNFSDAAKELGIMMHYISDMAVYGHVMGSHTFWGEELHHSDYENYIDTRTNSYQDIFNNFLVFDGNLTVITAYEAALKLAYDSTFDGNSNLTCVWMDTHYNWNNSQFVNRAGESLNLAVNAVADILHTFYSRTVIPEFPSNLFLYWLLFLVLPFILFAKNKGLRY